MRYDYSIFHTQGSMMHIADSLSRASYPDYKDREREEKVEAHVRFMVCCNRLVDGDVQEVRRGLSKDKVLLEILGYSQTSWPRKDCVSAGARRFYQFKEELVAQDDILLRGHRLVIPESLQEEMLARIHQGHQGIVKCSRRARETVWWPGINQDIQQLVENCRICLQEQRVKHQPLKTTPLPEGPWREVGSDLLEFRDKVYLLVVDYYSRWIEVFELKEMTSKSVISKLKNSFARFGVPHKLRSDNGGCYHSEMFREFAESYGFQHSKSSPKYPESNGLAERSVQTIKGLWKKSQDFHQSLMVYRATPLESGYSPAELMLGRNIRTGLPQYGTRPKYPFREKDEALKKRQKENFDRRTRAKALPSLEHHEKVWIKTNGNDGEEGVVVTETEEPDSYLVQRGNNMIRRNRKHLTPLPEEIPGAEEPAGVSADPSEPERTETDQPVADVSDQRVITRSGRVSRPNPKFSDFVKY
jgi:transposase InsO family protein